MQYAPTVHRLLITDDCLQFTKKRTMLTDIPGLKVGHWTNAEAATGCTVVLCPDGAVAGVDVRGTAPGTREVALLDPVCAVQEVHAIMLSGGSAFGLAAADGAVRWLEEHKYGFNVGVAKVPIVPSAILFDLPIGKANVRPTAEDGYAACLNASSGPIPLGNVGAGTGATVGKILGVGQSTKGGLGSASVQIAGGIIVSALVAVNAFGDVVDPKTGQIVAGARKLRGGGFVDTVAFASSRAGQAAARVSYGRFNTTLAVVATNAKLSKVAMTKVAQMAHDGMARTIRPIHTHMDGDVVFALSYGKKRADVNLVGALAADVLAEGILTAVNHATTLAGIPAARTLSYE